MRPRCPHCDQRVRILVGRCKACGGSLEEAPAPEPEALVKADGSETDRIESADKIRFQCPGCGKRMSIPIAQTGKTGRCPRCKEEITLPRIASGGTESGIRRGLDLDVAADPRREDSAPDQAGDDSANGSDDDPYERLRKLKSLVDEGILTEEEFQRKKAAILDLL